MPVPAPPRPARIARVPAGAPASEGRVLAAVVATGLVLGLVSLLRRPDLHYSASFLIGDQGFSLHVTDRLLDGQRLYQEVAFPYGPIPAYLHVAVAALFGNSARTYNAIFLVLSVVNLALVYTLLRRCASRPVAVAVAIVGMTPSLLIPGSLVGAYTSSLYVPLERMLLILLALAWRPPALRTGRDAAWLGLVLGLFPGVRFGVAFFAGAAIVAVDALVVLRGTRRVTLARWARTLGTTLLVFLLCQAVWTAGALLLLSREVAADFLWPSYMLGSYEGWISAGARTVRWEGWNTFFGQYLTPVLGTAAALGGITHLLHRGRLHREESAYLALFIPAVFFALGAAGLFRHVHHYRQYMWALALPAAWVAQRADTRGRAAIVALLLPCFLLNLKSVFVNAPSPALRPVVAANRERLWLAPRFEAGVAAVRRATGALPAADGAGLLFLPLGAGMHHFYRIPSHVRQTWLLPRFIRPYDEAGLLASLDRTRAVVILTPAETERVGKDPCTWAAPASPFPRALCPALGRRLEAPVRVAPGFWVAAVKPRRGAGIDPPAAAAAP